MKIRLVETADGSHSLMNDNLDESYHNLKGALTESLYVFIDKGLARFQGAKHEISILEIGLGTGLNVLLTALKAPEFSIPKLHITSLELYPLPNQLSAQLNFPQCLPQYPEAADILKNIHQAPSGETILLRPGCRFTFHHVALENFDTAPGSYDLVYFDAFAPAKQRDIWAFEPLEKVRRWMRPGGTLVTYCAMGQFKRDLKTLGFSVERLPGCLGKREMTRAQVPVQEADLTR